MHHVKNHSWPGKGLFIATHANYTCHGDTPIYLVKYERYIKQVKIDILTLLADFNSSTAQGSWLEKGGTFGPMNPLQITKAHAKSDLQLQ